MKAYVYTKPFTIEMQNRPLPEPGNGEVRVKVKAASICGSDTNGFKGVSAMRVPPLVMGHEFAGVIDAVGAGVSPNYINQRVSVYPTIACGQCHDCKSGIPNVCSYRHTIGTTMPAGPRDGAFAEYVLVPEQNIIPLPDCISYEEAAMFEPAAVSLRGAKMMGDIKGQTVAVFGAGPIGLLAMQAAKALGAKMVIGIDIVDSRLELAKSSGSADYTINARDQDVVAMVMEQTDGIGVYACVDAVGIAASLNTCIKMTRNAGTVAMIGMAAEEIDGFAFKSCVTREITLQGSYCYVDEIWQIADMLAAGDFHFEQLITSVVPMGQIQQKMEELISGNSTDVKVILV